MSALIWWLTVTLPLAVVALVLALALRTTLRCVAAYRRTVEQLANAAVTSRAARRRRMAAALLGQDIEPAAQWAAELLDAIDALPTVDGGQR